MRASLFIPLALALCAVEAGAQEQVDRTIPFSASGRVEIVNVSGSVRVVGSDRAEIRITGELGSRVERLAVDGNAQQTRIEVVIPRNPGRNVCSGDACSAELEIRVPSGAQVAVRGTSAEVAVSGVRGEINARSTSGDVMVSGSPRTVDASSTSGSVRVDATTRIVRASSTSGSVNVSGTVQERVTAESVSGNVNVDASTPELAAETVSGGLRVSSVSRRATVSTVSGSASVRDSRIQYLSFESVSGNLSFDGDLLSGAAVDIESHSGSITLSLPGNVSAEFDVSTFSGGISNAFGPSATGTSRYVPSKELRFRTGNGSGGVIKVRTFSGSVQLKKR